MGAIRCAKPGKMGLFEELVQSVDDKAGHKIGIQTKISAISKNNSSCKVSIFANAHCIIAPTYCGEYKGLPSELSIPFIYNHLQII